MLNTILIVEDDYALQNLFSHALRNVPCRLDIVDDGQAALDYLMQHTPQLIFLDMRLPYINGETVLDYIQNEPRFEGSRVIVISATQSYGMLPQVEEFILKPIMPSAIIAIVQETLGAQQ